MPSQFFYDLSISTSHQHQQQQHKLQLKNDVVDQPHLKQQKLLFKTHLQWYSNKQGFQTAGRNMKITKNNQGSCEWCQVQFAGVLDQIEGNSGPYSLQSLELQPYYHNGSNSLEH